MNELGTLRDIATNDLGLSGQTLYGVRDRHDDFPAPATVTPSGYEYYRRTEVVSFYQERIETLPTYNRDGGRAAS